MKGVPAARVRNFAIAGHAGSGKTSLAELMLHKAGKSNRLGSVEQNNTVSDYRSEEHDKQCSLYATLLNCTWNDTNLYFTDTPGNADFFGDTTAALSVCDTALVVVDGVSGIEIGSSRAWRVARRRNCPRAIFVNSLDRENADFSRVLEQIQETWGRTACIPITIPVGKEADLSGVVHVLRSNDVPADIADQVEFYRSTLMDTVAESDEDLMMRYLDGEELSEEEVSTGLHAAIMNCSLIPIFAGSVARDIGVTELLNGAVNLFPNPLLQGKIETEDGHIAVSEDGEGKAFVFKSIIDPFIGQLSIFRVYSGTITADSEVHNVSRGSRERIGHLLRLNGKDQEDVDEAVPGEVVAVAKLKDTHINDTLTVNGSVVKFPPITFPKATMSYACYAVKKGEEDKISTGLHKMSEEDPTVSLRRDEETHEMLLWGLGDQHLANVVNRLKTNYKVEVDLRTPRVPYRETITNAGDAEYRHKKQTGGHGQFAVVYLRIEPTPDSEFEFVNEVVGGNIPRNYIPAVEKGVADAMTRGPLANCRVINVKATVYDGKFHAVDSSDMAFQIAGRGAFRKAMAEAKPILLEPIMSVEIHVPDEYMGDIHGDLNHRRGRILGMDVEEGMQVVKADVPLAEMFSYSSQLRSLTQGRGTFDMEFSRYEQVPANVAKDIQEKAAQERHDEE